MNFNKRGLTKQIFFQHSQKTTAMGHATPAPSRYPLGPSGATPRGFLPNSVHPRTHRHKSIFLRLFLRIRKIFKIKLEGFLKRLPSTCQIQCFEQAATWVTWHIGKMPAIIPSSHHSGAFTEAEGAQQWASALVRASSWLTAKPAPLLDFMLLTPSRA